MSILSGWISANLEDGPLLESLGVELGAYDELFEGFEECRVCEETVNRLRPYWGQFVWHFKPLGILTSTPKAA
jgi:hypothetical protein